MSMEPETDLYAFDNEPKRSSCKPSAASAGYESVGVIIGADFTDTETCVIMVRMPRQQMPSITVGTMAKVKTLPDFYS